MAGCALPESARTPLKPVRASRPPACGGAQRAHGGARGGGADARRRPRCPSHSSKPRSPPRRTKQASVLAGSSYGAHSLLSRRMPRPAPAGRAAQSARGLGYPVRRGAARPAPRPRERRSRQGSRAQRPAAPARQLCARRCHGRPAGRGTRPAGAPGAALPERAVPRTLASWTPRAARPSLPRAAPHAGAQRLCSCTLAWELCFADRGRRVGVQQALYRCHCAVRVPSQMQMHLCHSHAPRYSTAATLAERVKALTALAEALTGKQRQDLLPRWCGTGQVNV